MIGTCTRAAGLAYIVGAYGTMMGAATIYQAAVGLGLTNHERNLAVAEFVADKGFRLLDQSQVAATALKNRVRFF